MILSHAAAARIIPRRGLPISPIALSNSMMAAATVATAMKTTAAMEAAVMSKPAVIEIHMMAEFVMVLPWMVHNEARIVAPGISPTP